MREIKKIYILTAFMLLFVGMSNVKAYKAGVYDETKGYDHLDVRVQEVYELMDNTMDAKIVSVKGIKEDGSIIEFHNEITTSNNEVEFKSLAGQKTDDNRNGTAVGLKNGDKIKLTVEFKIQSGESAGEIKKYEVEKTLTEGEDNKCQGDNSMWPYGYDLEVSSADFKEVSVPEEKYSLEIIYKEKETEKELKTKKIINDINNGTYNYECDSIEGYTALNEKIEYEINGKNGTLTCYYQPQKEEIIEKIEEEITNPGTGSKLIAIIALFAIVTVLIIIYIKKINKKQKKDIENKSI